MKILVDPQYNPDLIGSITSKTRLGPGITCAKFLGDKGSPTTFKRLYNESYKGPCDRLQIARNLVLHSQAMQKVISNPFFSQHRLIVSEGIYEPNSKYEISEEDAGSEADARSRARTLGGSFGKGPDGWVVRVPKYTGERAGGVNALRRDGRAIVYQIIGRNGKSDPAMSFDLAVFWKDYLDYNKITLDYDTFDPSGELTSSIVLEMPTVPDSYDVSYKYDIETRFNGELQARNEFLEILP